MGGRIYPRPTWAGKAATFFQILAVLSGLSARYLRMPGTQNALFWVAAAFTIVSGLQYLVQGMRYLHAIEAAEHEESRETTLYR
jgi:phosphatidylglycerophosphate synthase